MAVEIYDIKRYEDFSCSRNNRKHARKLSNSLLTVIEILFMHVQIALVLFILSYKTVYKI